MEPPNKGHFGSGAFVLYLEAVPLSETSMNCVLKSNNNYISRALEGIKSVDIKLSQESLLVLLLKGGSNGSIILTCTNSIIISIILWEGPLRAAPL